MSLVPIDNVGQVGLIMDVPPYNLPPNAWSDGNNIRFLDDGVKKCAGYQEVMDNFVERTLLNYERCTLYRAEMALLS